MVGVAGNFSQLAPKRVLAAGDFMLDTYTLGKVKRISPEAPVSVLQVEREELRPGGTGNVVLNLASLGAQVIALGRIGNDPSGKALRDAFADEAVDTRALFVQEHYPTPVKNRLIAGNQQIVRVDHEKVMPLSSDLERRILQILPELVQSVDVVAISDYAKGFLSKSVLAALIKEARERRIPVIVDPKGVDFSKYSHATVIKPNESEAIAASGLSEESGLGEMATRLLEVTGVEALFITRSEMGIAVFTRQGKRHDAPVVVRQIRDVTGAGDTVLAVLTLALANGMSLESASYFSNVAAGIAIEYFGCARVTMKDLARRLLDQDASSKIFDQRHLAVMQEALRGSDYNVLGVNSCQGMTSALFKHLRLLARNAECELIVYVKETLPDSDFVALLASLHEVSFIVLRGESLRDLCTRIYPKEVYDLEEDGTLTILEHTDALLS